MNTILLCLFVALGPFHLQARRIHQHFTNDSPEVPPTPWFLTPAEIAAARFGVPRNGLADWSFGNSIKILMNGAEFMPRLHEVMESAQPGDFIHGTGWQLDGGVMLKPNPSDKNESARTTLLATLSRAVSRGVHVRVLISSNLYQHTSASRLCDDLMKLPACSKSRCCAPDNRHGHEATGTNHEKIWVVGKQQESRLIAFTGSMDVAMSRYDDWYHNTSSEAWKMNLKDPMLMFAWHGNMFEIEGQAAEDIENTFWQRWNDDPVPFHFIGKLPSYVLWTPSLMGQNAQASAEKPTAIQVVRTFGCQGAQNQDWTDTITSKLYQNFAPHGEYTYAAIWFKALRQARRYIFVADQFMFFPEAVEAIAEAAQHVDFVVMVMDRGQVNLGKNFIGKYGASTFEAFMQYSQYEALFKPLARLDPTGALAKKVHTFSLVQEGKPEDQFATQIYDHEKTLIIDDEFALTGSNGVERTGFTNDAELSLAVWTPPNNKKESFFTKLRRRILGAPKSKKESFAIKLRRRIWGEFLRMDPSDAKLADPSTAFQEWLRQANAGDKRVRHYTPKQGKWQLQYPEMYDFSEPDGRCQDKQHKPMWEAVRKTGTQDWAEVVAQMPNVVAN